MSDIVLNIDEAKTNLSQYLNNLTGEDRIVLCKRNSPFAEIRLLPEENRPPRRLGVAEGEFTVPETFFEPWPDDILDAFEGRS